MAAETTASPIAIQIPEPENRLACMTKPLSNPKRSRGPVPSALKFVPNTPDSFYVSRFYRVGLQFLPQPSAMDCDGADVLG